MHCTIHNGKRGVAVAFLKPALTRKNLQVLTKAQVIQINFDGKKAVGVTYKQGRREQIVTAGRVILLLRLPFPNCYNVQGLVRWTPKNGACPHPRIERVGETCKTTCFIYLREANAQEGINHYLPPIQQLKQHGIILSIEKGCFAMAP